MITTVIVSKDGKSIQETVYALTKGLSEKHTKILADEHQKELIKNIDESRDRVKKPQGPHLADSISVEKVESGYGVGNINTINSKTPWMWWINFGRALSGRTIPPGTSENPRITGHFEPSNKGIFTKGQPKFPMNPKKAIQAHNFIERSLSVMLSKVRQLLK